MTITITLELEKISNLNKKFGDGIVMKLGDATRLEIEAIPTGSLSVDIALGVGGAGAGAADLGLGGYGGAVAGGAGGDESGMQ